jgi:hypothetical protein
MAKKRLERRTHSMARPPTKIYAAFISHKKIHSKNGDSSETLAIRIKVLQSVYTFHALLICSNYVGYVVVEIDQGLL